MRALRCLETMQRRGTGGGWPHQAASGVFFQTAVLDYRFYKDTFPPGPSRSPPNPQRKQQPPGEQVTTPKPPSATQPEAPIRVSPSDDSACLLMRCWVPQRTQISPIGILGADSH